MTINEKILSIPPYISTSWKNVISLHVEKDTLVIGLVNGSTIEIPELNATTLESTFSAHRRFLEKEGQMKAPPPPGSIIPPGMLDESASIMSLPIRFGMDGNMGNLLHHNPDAADSPDLPKEMLEKIASFSKVIGYDNSENFPKPEPHCNCMHCQILKAMQEKVESLAEEELEEEITEEDLRFREWDIDQRGNQLYVVSNPLSPEEQYNVFLGKPVGCTCGQESCEHIRAVLNS